MVMLPDPTDYGNKPGDGPLRPGGQSLDGLPQTQADLPSTPSPAAQKQAHDVGIVRDLWGGTSKIRERSTVYLPKAPGEDPQNYASRLTRSVFFNAYRRTVEGLTGLVFRKDPVLSDDVPPQIAEHWENIDNAGTHGDVFAREQLQDALQAGHNLILVEYPNTGGVKLTMADEAPLRPYWIPIKKENVLSWRTRVEGGRTVLTQLVIKECQYVPDGAFGEKERERYRVFYKDDSGVVGFRLLEITPQRQVVVVDEGTYPTQEEIPVAEVVTSGRRGMFESDPPLMDVAYLNIAHYQQWSDAAYSRYKTCVPVLFGAGVVSPTDDQGQPVSIQVGPNSAVWASDPSAKLAYVSHDGASLDNCEQALETLKADMGTLGLAMLAPQKRTAETAEAKRLDKATSDSALSVTARGLQDAFERALGFHARYLRLDSGGSVEINRDFEGLAMDPAVMTAFAALIGQGLPWELALEQLQKGGRIAEDVDVETVALEIASARAAEAELQREQRVGELEDATGGPPKKPGPVTIELPDGRKARVTKE
jgi:hypothetical protein